jgi:hypothetical protein
MGNRDLIGSLFWMVIGVIFCAGAWKYGIFRGRMPGAGFFPFMASIVLIALSLFVFIPSLWTGRKDPVKRENFFARPDSWKGIVLALAALFAYWQALGYLGFLLTTVLFMIFLLRFIEPQRWVIVLAVSILTTTLAYMIFNLWLKVRLPAGILKI